jgi:hypothetical protein
MVPRPPFIKLFPSLTIEGAASGCLNNERVITVSAGVLINWFYSACRAIIFAVVSHCGSDLVVVLVPERMSRNVYVTIRPKTSYENRINPPTPKFHLNKIKSMGQGSSCVFWGFHRYRTSMSIGKFEFRFSFLFTFQIDLFLGLRWFVVIRTKKQVSCLSIIIEQPIFLR